MGSSSVGLMGELLQTAALWPGRTWSWKTERGKRQKTRTVEKNAEGGNLSTGRAQVFVLDKGFVNHRERKERAAQPRGAGEHTTGTSTRRNTHKRP